jgi:hypothetical protein
MPLPGLAHLPATLAWRPFLEPLPLHDPWFALLIPLVLVIALVYKTLKLPDLADLPGATARLTGLILLALALAAATLYLLTLIV